MDWQDLLDNKELTASEYRLIKQGFLDRMWRARIQHWIFFISSVVVLSILLIRSIFHVLWLTIPLIIIGIFWFFVGIPCSFLADDKENTHHLFGIYGERDIDRYLRKNYKCL